MHSVLFVCTANRCRSPIAAGLFINLLKRRGFSLDEWRIESAGTWAKAGLPALVQCLDVANSYDVDLSGHLSQSVSDVDLDSYDIIIVMERGHYESLAVEYAAIENKLFMLSTLAGIRNKDVPDPVISSRESLMGVAREISDYLKQAFGPICQLAMKSDQ